MKKIILLAILIMISGCNFPKPTPTVSQNAVATEVARLLSTHEGPTEQATVLPQDQKSTDAVKTPPFQQTEITISALATNTAVPSITPSPTLSPDNPKATLGKSAWSDDFSSGKAFGLEDRVEDNGYTKISVTKGMLVFTGLVANGWFSWRLASPKPERFYLEASFRTKTCSGNDTYGLVLRAKDYSSGAGYYYGATCDGYYSFWKWEGDDVTPILSHIGPQPVITPGQGQTNFLGIVVQNDEFILYANDKKIDQVRDTTYTAPGYNGFFIMTNQTPGFTYEVDDVAYWNLP